MSLDALPGFIIAAIVNLYPTVKKVKYANGKGIFEAEFTHKSNEMSAVFEANGLVKETETEVSRKHLMVDRTGKPLK